MRELYSDDEEKLFDAMRPVMANGIDDLATRPDLLDRAVILHLPPIADEARREEDELWPAFYKARPSILGALLTAVAVAMRNRPAVRLPVKPRMADFAVWATASEPAFGWPSGAFLDAYCGNREDAIAVALDSSPIGPAIRGLMHGSEYWEGTAQDLLAELSSERRSDKATRRRRDWPKTPKALANAVRRIAPNLRQVGIAVTTEREAGGNRRRLIRLERTGKAPSRQSQPSRSPAGGPQASNLPGPSRDGGDADRPPNRPAVDPDSTLAGPIRDGRDDRDGPSPTCSNGPDYEPEEGQITPGSGACANAEGPAHSAESGALWNDDDAERGGRDPSRQFRDFPMG